MKKISRLAFVVNFILALLATFGKYYNRPFLRQPSRVPQAGRKVSAVPAAAVLMAASSTAPEPPPT